MGPTTASTARAFAAPPGSTGGLSGSRRIVTLVSWMSRWTRVLRPSGSVVATYMTSVRSRPLPGAPGAAPSGVTGAETVSTQSFSPPTADTGPGARSSAEKV